MTKRFSVLCLVVLTLLFSQTAYAASYELDAHHTTVSFKVRHLLTKVMGTFNEFSGSFNFDPAKIEASSVQVVVKTDSIDTRLAPRDKHLRSEDFFDVEKFPEMTYRSTSVKKISDNEIQVDGILSLHGVEKVVPLQVEYLGEVQDPWGSTLAGFSASAKINRKDFGLNWNKTVETGQVLVGDEVEIIIEVEARRQDA